jgi:hypothetical protein
VEGNKTRTEEIERYRGDDNLKRRLKDIEEMII